MWTSFYPAQSANAWDTNAFKQSRLQLQDLELKQDYPSPSSTVLSNNHQAGNPARKK